MSSRIRDWGLRSPYDKTGGLVYFGRMLDKIRSHARRELPEAYAVNLGKGFDEKCTGFLRVSYELVVEYVHDGLEDEAILQSCFAMGRQPSEAEIYMWNEFMRKRGWHDDVSETLESEKKREAMLSRSEIQTMFQFMDADEGRLVNDNYAKASPVRKRIAASAKEWPVRTVDKDTLDGSRRVGSPIEQRRLII